MCISTDVEVEFCIFPLVGYFQGCRVEFSYLRFNVGNLCGSEFHVTADTDLSVGVIHTKRAVERGLVIYAIRSNVCV